MARVEENIRGLVRAELRGPEPEKLLNACLAENLPLIRPESVDRWTLHLGVFEGDLPRLEAMERFSNKEISAMVPIMGSWKTRPI